MSEDDELIKHMTKLIATSLDRIEQLTAERDANGKDYCALMERYDALVVNNARLREALKAFVAHYPKGINPDLDAACFAARTELEPKP